MKIVNTGNYKKETKKQQRNTNHRRCKASITAPHRNLQPSHQINPTPRKHYDNNKTTFKNNNQVFYTLPYFSLPYIVYVP